MFLCGPLVKWPKTPASHAGNMGSNPVRVTIFLFCDKCLFSSVGRAFVVNVIPEKLTKFKSYKHCSSVIIYRCLFSSVGRAFVVNVIPEKLTKFLTYKHRA